MTADLLKDPHIMQALTSTYVRTLNEVVSRSNTNSTKTISTDSQQQKATTASTENSTVNRDLVLPTQNNMLLLTGSDEDGDQEDEEDEDEDENDEDDDAVLDEVVESTFEEFILAAAALAAATANSVNSGASSSASGANSDPSSNLNRMRQHPMSGDNVSGPAQLSIQLNQKKFESHMDSFYGLNGRCGGDSIADLKERLNDISRLSKELENYNVEEDGDDEEDSDDVEDEDDEEDDEGEEEDEGEFVDALWLGWYKQ